MGTQAIQKAVEIFGGQASLSRVLKVSPGMVYQWVKEKRRVPADRCPAIEKATGGKVRCEDLRPDIDWSVLRCRCAEDREAA